MGAGEGGRDKFLEVGGPRERRSCGSSRRMISQESLRSGFPDSAARCEGGARRRVGDTRGKDEGRAGRTWEGSGGVPGARGNEMRMAGAGERKGSPRL